MDTGSADEGGGSGGAWIYVHGGMVEMSPVTRQVHGKHSINLEKKGGEMMKEQKQRLIWGF